MSNESIYKQDTAGDAPVPGGPFLIQILFREPVQLPDKERFLEVLRRHIGNVTCYSEDEISIGFTADDHVAHFTDGSAPVMLTILKSSFFEGETINGFLRGQMWDCPDDRQRILEESKFQIMAVDLLAGGLASSQERANLDMDYLEALAELFPTCEAFYLPSCGRLLPPEMIRSSTVTGMTRFVRFGVNCRLVNIEGTEDIVVDTLGMGTLFLPDIQYHCHGLDPNDVVYHARNIASYLLDNASPDQEQNTILDGDTIDGLEGGKFSQNVRWVCHYEKALIRPEREVLDIHTGQYASGQR